MFGKAIPILPVSDLARSISYYVQKLGFQVNWQQNLFASVSREHCTLFFCVGDQGHAGTWVWIGVPDAGELHREFQTRGASIRNPPTNYQWAYEMQVSDPDGHVLRFGSDPLPNEPFGMFRDMEGRLWPALDSA